MGAHGAGHYVKMVHNGIEYGMMQAIAEGFSLMHKSPYGLNLAEIANLWMQGSVVRSWLVELAGRALSEDPALQKIRGWVEDSGEGRWTVQDAIDQSVPAWTITAALFTRFRSREDDSFADRMRAVESCPSLIRPSRIRISPSSPRRASGTGGGASSTPFTAPPSGPALDRISCCCMALAGWDSKPSATRLRRGECRINRRLSMHRRPTGAPGHTGIVETAVPGARNCH